MHVERLPAPDVPSKPFLGLPMALAGPTICILVSINIFFNQLVQCIVALFGLAGLGILILQHDMVYP